MGGGKGGEEGEGGEGEEVDTVALVPHTTSQSELFFNTLPRVVASSSMFSLFSRSLIFSLYSPPDLDE